MRDTQFAKFAALLLEEILGQHDGMLDVSDRWKEQAQLFIAQRAYDFAEHVLGTAEVDPCGVPTSDLVKKVPDLIEWPEDEDARWEHYANHQYDGVDFGEENE